MFEYWKRQGDTPLFPDVSWSRPENKAFLPKITIVGGSSLGFAKSANIYQGVQESGCGAKLLLPSTFKDSLPVSTDIIFVEATKTGSFTGEVYSHVGAIKSSTDLFIISEDSGKESQLTQSISRLMADDDSDVMFLGDSILATDSYFDELIDRKSKTILVVNAPQLQKIVSRLPTATAVQSSDGLVDIVKVLHEATSHLKITFAVILPGEVLVSASGLVFSTKFSDQIESVASRCAGYHYGNILENYIVALCQKIQ